MEMKTSEKILAVVDSKTILEFYARDALGGKALKHNLKIQSPFRKERTASFCFYLKDGQWYFYDHGDGSIKGNCFNYVMILYNCDFKEVLKKIITDFNLNLDDEKILQASKIKQKSNYMKSEFKLDPRKQKEFERVKIKEFSDEDIDYWMQYGIGIEVLNKYSVKSIDSTPKQAANGSYISSTVPKDKRCFGYFNETFVKIYKPLENKKYKFLFFGNKPLDFYFGYKQLPKAGDKVFLVGGEKDTLTMASHGYNALSLNSESSSMPQGLLDDLKERFKHLIILYDNDDTGIREAHKLSEECNLPMIQLPKMEKGGKDISDFVKLKNQKQ